MSVKRIVASTRSGSGSFHPPVSYTPRRNRSASSSMDSVKGAPDHTAERRQSVDDPTLVHDIERPIPDHAIGNRDVTIARITGYRLHRGRFALLRFACEPGCD